MSADEKGRGPMSLGDEHGPQFLGVKGLEPRACSDRTAPEVDREVQTMVLEARGDDG